MQSSTTWAVSIGFGTPGNRSLACLSSRRGLRRQFPHFRDDWVICATSSARAGAANPAVQVVGAGLESPAAGGV